MIVYFWPWISISCWSLCCSLLPSPDRGVYYWRGEFNEVCYLTNSFPYLYFHWKRIFSFELFGQCLLAPVWWDDRVVSSVCTLGSNQLPLMLGQKAVRLGESSGCFFDDLIEKCCTHPGCFTGLSSQHRYGSASGDMLESCLLRYNRRWFSLRQLVNIGPRCPMMSQTMTTATSELAG